MQWTSLHSSRWHQCNVQCMALCIDRLRHIGEMEVKLYAV
jgi:hypothetical protein